MKWDKIVIDELSKRIVGEKKSREIIFLCALGKLVIDAEYSSFNLLVHAGSSGGKDYVVRNVLKIFNPYSIISRTRISPTVLNYWKPWEKGELKPASWDEKVLYLPDVSDTILNCEAMKLLCSDGSFITITKDNKAVDIEIVGKPVIITTTANSTPSQETLNRFSVVKLDESEKQTKRIHKFRPEDYGKTALDFIAKLRPCKVKITKTMQNKIAEIFPSNLLRERRNFTRFLDFIKAVTAFHQEKNPEYGKDSLQQVITADWKDYDIAKDVFMNLYSGISEIPLNKQQKEIVQVMEKEKDPLSAKEILQRLGSYITIQGFRPHLDNLVNLGVFDVFSLRDVFNNAVIKYLISEEYSQKQPIKLPNSGEI